MVESNTKDLFQKFERLKKRIQETQSLAEKLEAAIEQERKEWELARTGNRPVRE